MYDILWDRSYVRSQNKFKNIEIKLSILSNHSDMKPEINNRKETKTFMNMWKLIDILLNNQWGKEEIKREIKTFHGANEDGNIRYQNLWNAAKQLDKLKKMDKFLEIYNLLRLNYKAIENMNRPMTSKKI